MLRSLLPLALLAVGIAACADDAPLPAAPRDGAPAVASRLAASRLAPSSALADVQTRLAPGLGASAEADRVRDALHDLVEHGPTARAERTLGAALTRLAEAHPERAADADAIRLAVLAR
jgi:hypothetical protein